MDSFEQPNVECDVLVLRVFVVVIGVGSHSWTCYIFLDCFCFGGCEATVTKISEWLLDKVKGIVQPLTSFTRHELRLHIRLATWQEHFICLWPNEEVFLDTALLLRAIVHKNDLACSARLIKGRDILVVSWHANLAWFQLLAIDRCWCMLGTIVKRTRQFVNACRPEAAQTTELLQADSVGHTIIIEDWQLLVAYLAHLAWLGGCTYFAIGNHWAASYTVEDLFCLDIAFPNLNKAKVATWDIIWGHVKVGLSQAVLRVDTECCIVPYEWDGTFVAVATSDSQISDFILGLTTFVV